MENLTKEFDDYLFLRIFFIHFIKTLYYFNFQQKSVTFETPDGIFRA